MRKNKIAIVLTLAIGMTMFPAINANAAIYNGWEQSGADWHYYNNGIMQKGWMKCNGNWYYFKDDGTMATGWIKESNVKGYYFNKKGVWIENTDDLYKISTDKTEYNEHDKNITVKLENNSDFDCIINADDNCLQKLNNDGLWEFVQVKDRNKLGYIMIKAHSYGTYTIDVDNLVDGKLQKGTYSIYNLFDGVKYERFEFSVK